MRTPSRTRSALTATALAVATLTSVSLGAATTPSAAADGGSTSGTTTTSVAVSADAYVDAAYPNRNWGTSPNALYNVSARTAFVKFDIPSRPDDVRLVSARLDTTTDRTQPTGVSVHVVADDWTEGGITAANAPALGAATATAAPAAGDPGASFDVTAAVAPLVDAGAPLAFAVRSLKGPGGVQARESGSGAVLVLEWEPDTLFGSNAWTGDGSTFTQALARQTAKYGQLEVVRVFYNGLPEAWPGKAGQSGGPVVVSFKLRPSTITSGRYDSFFTTWFATAPRDRTVFWVLYHEPEDDIADGAFTAADYRAAYARLDALADATGNPALRTTTVFMSWTLNPASGRSWETYWPGSDVVDVMAFDAYNRGVQRPVQVYDDPAAILGPIVATAASVGKPWGIAEYGSKLVAGDTGVGRAAWLRASVAYQRAQKATFVSYFDAYGGTVVDPEYRLLDEPSQTAWRWAVSES